MNSCNKIKILSSGIYLPPQIVKSDDLLTDIRSDVQYGIPINWMSDTMGIKERRMASDSDKPSDLAIFSAEQALESCPLEVLDNIGLVVFCGIERDQPEPATAHTVHHALGLKAKHVFDVANACFGFFDGIEIASNFIQSGCVQYALVVTGEVPTRVLKSWAGELKKGVDLKTARNKIGGLSVGDAGGAIVMGPSDDSSGFEVFNTVMDSSHINKCIYRLKPDGTTYGHIMMGPITKAILTHHQDLIDDTLLKLGWSEFDWVLTHQMGKRPFEKFGSLQGVKPEKMIKTYDVLGNITSATFPVSYHKLINSSKICTGDRVGGCFAGSGLAIGQLGYTY